ncbi:MAG: Crp/Fnr family transcriptional regulator [Vulcanococcus sp.]|jgi:CRP/FNR family cyclic AMP-dependent transcriptional regulator
MELSALHTIQALAGGLAVRLVHAHELIYTAGAPGDSIYCVLAGEIQLAWPDGGKELFQPGQVFGVGALVEHDHRRHGTARALQDSELIEMNREEFLFALQETPMFALQLLASLEERLCRSHG